MLGLLPWKIPKRDIAKVDSEYDKDKYGALLDYCLSAPSALTLEEVKNVELVSDPGKHICISLGNDLFEVSLEEATRLYYDVLIEAIGQELPRVRTVLELGAGYGYNLSRLRQRFPNLRFSGGEYSRNALAIAARINPDIQMSFFNFYEPETYRLIEAAEPPILLFTCYAVHQLPSAAGLVDFLAVHRARLNSVIHFEPAMQLHDESLLGLMRKSYIQLNDYNRDLIEQLRRHPLVENFKTRTDVIGLNPLHPLSIIHWKFKAA